MKIGKGSLILCRGNRCVEVIKNLLHEFMGMGILGKTVTIFVPAFRNVLKIL